MQWEIAVSSEGLIEMELFVGSRDKRIKRQSDRQEEVYLFIFAYLVSHLALRAKSRSGFRVS